MPKLGGVPNSVRYANLIESVRQDLAMVAGLRPEMIRVYTKENLHTGAGKVTFDGPAKRMVFRIGIETRLFEHTYNTQDYIALLAVAGHELSHCLYSKANHTDTSWKNLDSSKFQFSARVQSNLAEAFCDINGMRLGLSRLGQPINHQILASFQGMVTQRREKMESPSAYNERVEKTCDAWGYMYPKHRAALLRKYQCWCAEAALDATKTFTHQLNPKNYGVHEKALAFTADLLARGWPMELIL